MYHLLRFGVQPSLGSSSASFSWSRFAHSPSNARLRGVSWGKSQQTLGRGTPPFEPTNPDINSGLVDLKGEVPREQKMFRGHLPRVENHQVYWFTKAGVQASPGPDLRTPLREPACAGFLGVIDPKPKLKTRPRNPAHPRDTGWLKGRGTARAECAQGTPTHSHTSPSILVY